MGGGGAGDTCFAYVCKQKDHRNYLLCIIMKYIASLHVNFRYLQEYFVMFHRVGRSEMNSKIFLHSVWARLYGTEWVISYLQINLIGAIPLCCINIIL